MSTATAWVIFLLAVANMITWVWVSMLQSMVRDLAKLVMFDRDEDES